MTALRVTAGAGGVWEAGIVANTSTIEWMIQSGSGLRFPVTAPTRGQSVVVRPV